ncbi:hypothetical protein BJ170DRAFT_686082 [Xylariales sp. AK1849]|nr:hypothetical protein BJ170DRAFT_686082 [Xylariales sp. AK1849]
METASFASRRPAATGLPHFHLPPPNPSVDIQIPRVTGSDGLSPLSSSIHSGSSQSSQTGGIAPYNPTGNWSSAYTYGSMSQGQAGLMQPNYGRQQIYSPSAGAGYNARTSQSPAMADGLAAPPSDSFSSPFPLAGGGSGHHSMLSQSSHQPQPLHNPILNSQQTPSQPPTPSTTAPTDSYSRPPHTPGYYVPPTSTPQQSSFPAYSSHSPTHPTPTTSGSLSRGIPASNTQHSSPMHASYYTQRQYGYPTLTSAMSGPVLSNVANPNGQPAMIGGGMHQGSHGYATHLGPHHMYSHGQPATQNDRPFKCDQCPQSFNRNHDLKRHKKIHLAVKPFPCGHCDKSFSRKDALKRHRLVKGCGNGKTSPTSGNDASPQDEVKVDPDSISNGDVKDT